MEKSEFGVAWSKQTVLHPVEAAILIAMALVLLTCNRRYAPWPLIVVACFVVPSQRIVIGTVDFTLMRLITMVGMLRIVAWGEVKNFHWNKLDTSLVVFTFLKAFIVLLVDIPGEFVARLGTGLDSLGIYLVCRCLIRDWSDVFMLVRGFIWIGVPVALAFVIEAQSHRNVFGIFGYVPDTPELRAGKFRAQAAFANPIIAGVFWSTLMPLMAALAWQGRKARWEALLGLVVASTIIFCCASSTPFVGLLFGVLGAMMFPLRKSMRSIRWMLLLGFCLFQVLSDKPAWRLLVDIDVVGGSTGYYRYVLFDQGVRHISEWWLMGGKIDTRNWSPELRDDTNHFLVVALQGGLPLLATLLITISLAFGGVGRMWRAAGTNRPAVIAAWALGISILMHVMSFLSVYYFGQVVMLWNMTLAIVGSLMPAKTFKRPLKKANRISAEKTVLGDHSFASAPDSFGPASLRQPHLN